MILTYFDSLFTFLTFLLNRPTWVPEKKNPKKVHHQKRQSLVNPTPHLAHWLVELRSLVVGSTSKASPCRWPGNKKNRAQGIKQKKSSKATFWSGKLFFFKNVCSVYCFLTVTMLKGIWYGFVGLNFWGPFLILILVFGHPYAPTHCLRWFQGDIAQGCPQHEFPGPTKRPNHVTHVMFDRWYVEKDVGDVFYRGKKPTQIWCILDILLQLIIEYYRRKPKHNARKGGFFSSW